MRGTFRSRPHGPELLLISLAGLDKLGEVYVNRYGKLTLAYDLRGDVNNLAQGLVNVMTDPKPDNLKKNGRLLTDSPKQAVDALSRIKVVDGTDTKQAMIRDLERSLDQFFGSMRPTISATTSARKWMPTWPTPSLQTGIRRRS